MSVEQKTYVMIGINLTPKIKQMNADELDDWLEEMEQFAENKDLKFIFDGMSGEYCVIGTVLNNGDDFDGMPLKIHHLASDIKEIKIETYEKLKDISTSEPSLISFTYWY